MGHCTRSSSGGAQPERSNPRDSRRPVTLGTEAEASREQAAQPCWGDHGSGVPGWLPGDYPLPGQPGDLGSHGPSVGNRERVGLTGRLRKPIVREPKRPHGAVLRASGRRGVPDARSLGQLGVPLGRRDRRCGGGYGCAERLRKGGLGRWRSSLRPARHTMRNEGAIPIALTSRYALTHFEVQQRPYCTHDCIS